ncbi:cytochrome P450 [Xylariaceae sp. FL0804]|nr:cytochrome P450 [Xylariaceae sp. FL0804]
MEFQIPLLAESLRLGIAGLFSSSLLLEVLALYVAYQAGIIIYRLTFHPLAKFPGPFFCRISYIQQCYYEAILNGKFIHKFPEYHHKYGPVVRISPNEVHLNDASLYHEIYKQNSAFTKDPISYALGVSEAMAFTVPVEKHKVKRKTLDPNFSKQRVGLMEDGLYDELELVFERIDEYMKRGVEVPIMELYFCYTGDIISRYLFGKSLGLVALPDFIERAESLIAYLSDAWVKVLWFTESLAKEAILQFDHEKVLLKSPVDETIFDRLLTEDSRRQKKGKHARPLTFRELADESTGILNVGTEPTATMLTRILEELLTVKLENGRLPLAKVEDLPYFTGFVKESLRYMPLVPGRLPRTVPKGGLFVPSINDIIPEGCVVGLSHLAIHFDPEIFEQPHDLAYAEIHLLLANLFTHMVWIDRVIVHSIRNLRINVGPKHVKNVG